MVVVGFVYYCHKNNLEWMENKERRHAISFQEGDSGFHQNSIGTNECGLTRWIYIKLWTQIWQVNGSKLCTKPF